MLIHHSQLRCNVVAGPDFKPCDRCIKHKLHCSIDNDFKRLGKRAAHEEMVQKLALAEAKLADLEARGISTTPSAGAYSYSTSPATAPVAPLIGPNEAAASRSLLDLSQSFEAARYPSITPGTSTRTLGRVTLSDQEVSDLFNIYFTSYHPFLPILSPELPNTAWYNLHPLLHWTMLAIASRHYEGRLSLLGELQQSLSELLWTTLSQVPQSYHVIKALCLLCSWPLPSSSTSQEPTMMLTGIMVQLSMQFGLHRPSHAQDFSRFRIELREEDIADRMNVWAACNIVAQRVSTGRGQPPLSRWAWFTHGLHLHRMNEQLRKHCEIERRADNITRTIFTMQRDHIVEVDQAQRSLQIDLLGRDLNEHETSVLAQGSTSKRPSSYHASSTDLL